MSRATRRTTLRIAAATLVALAFAAPAAEARSPRDARAGGEIRRVRAVDEGINRFRPRRITIDRGTRVRWVNVGSLSHTTTSDDGDWDARLSPGDRFTRRFRRAGTFTFHCSIHPEMVGTIVVE
jgi:plastocyanin